MYTKLVEQAGNCPLWMLPGSYVRPLIDGVGAPGEVRESVNQIRNWIAI